MLECCSGLPYAQTKGLYPFGKTTYKRTRIDVITSQFGLEQLTHEPTHIIGEKSFCIDLIFASQPNLVVKSGFQSSLHLLYIKIIITK